MALRQRNNRAYGITNALQELAPPPIQAQRAPTTADLGYPIGQTWIDIPNDAAYTVTSNTAGSATWSTSPASGVGTFTSATINPGNVTVTAGDVAISAGDLDVTLGNVTIGGNITVAGTSTLNGDLDFTSAALIDLISTLDAAPSILLHANGGVSEQIYLHSDQGTAVNSILLGSDVGGITLLSGLSSADAINITASAGGSGIDIDSGTAGFIVDTTGAISLDGAAASNWSLTGAGIDLTLESAAGRLLLLSGEDAAQSIYIRTNAGVSETLDIHADQGTGVASVNVHSDVGGVTISGGVASADAVNITSSDAAGGVDIDGGTAGVIVDSTGAISLDAAAASNFSTSGAGIDLDLASAAGRIIATAGEDAAQAIYLHADAGVSETIHIHADQGTGVASVNIASDVGGITLDGGVASADAINITSSDAAGGVDIDSGTAGTIMDSTGGISLDAAAASNFNVTGAGIDLTLGSAAGRVIVDGGEDAAQVIYLHANAGVSETIHIHSDLGTGVASVNIASDVGGITLDSGLASADAINITSSDAAGGVDIDSGTAGTILDSTGGISLDAAAASNFNVTGAGIDLTLGSAAGRVIVDAGEDAAQAIYLHADAGVSETIDIHADQGTGVSSINVRSDVGGISLTSGLASADAINITSSDAAGGVDIDSGTGGMFLVSTGAVSITGAAASTFFTTGAGIDLTLDSTAGSIIVDGGEAASDAVQITASDAAGGVDIAAGTGGIDLAAAGILTATDAVATVASPTAAAVINTNLCTATYTGFTTASSAAQTFTITNSLITTTSALMVTVTNLGSNDAQMTLYRVKQLAGSVELYTTNNGAAALNGNVVICCWVYNA